MNGKMFLSRNLLLALLLAIGSAITAVLLTKYNRLGGLSLDTAFLSVGVLLLVQAALIRRTHHEKVERERMRDSTYEPPPLKEDIQATRFGAALIVAAFAGLLSLIPQGTQGRTPLPPDQVQSLIQLLDRTESDLNECAKSKASECKPIDGAVAARMEGVLHALEDLSKKPDSHSAANGASSGGTVLIVALVLVIGAIIWLTVKSSPSKTPLAITAALVGAIIKGAKLLPQPGGDFYWYSVFGLLVIGGLVVLIAAVVWAWRGPSPAAGAPPVVPAAAPGSEASSPPQSFWLRLFKKSPERPDSDSPMVIGFSILLVAFAMAYLGKAHDKTQTPVNTCPACPALSVLKPSKKEWHPVRGFGEKKQAAETSDLGQFKRELESAKFTDADLL